MQQPLLRPEIAAFIHSFSEGVVLTDTSLKLLWINPIASQLLGLPADEWTGKSSEALIKTRPDLSWIFSEGQPTYLQCWDVMQCQEHDCPLWEKSFTDCWTTRSCPVCAPPQEAKGNTTLLQNRCSQCKIYNSYIYQRERAIPGDNNQRIVIQVHTAPLCDSAGNVIGKIRQFRDVTQDRELGQMKDDFLSVLSHELRSPLTSIRSYAEILQHYSDTDPETQKEFLKIIFSESERLDQMIDDMMELQQLESARSGWKNEEISLPEVVLKVFENYKNILTKKNIVCRTEMDPRCPKIWTDSEKIYHVISTLVRNLMNQTPTDGMLVVKALPMKGQRRSDRDFFIKFTMSNVPPNLPDITGDSSTASNTMIQEGFPSEKKTNLGLGYTLCKKILDQYGGNLWMEETAEIQGHTFHFTLPSCVPLSTPAMEGERETEEPESGQEVQPVVERGMKRLLIVDDDPALVNATTFALKKEGYQVFSTTSARRALEMVPETRPDLIISDIRMPEMDGYEFFQEIKENEATKMIPFIFVSAKRETDDKIRGFKTGVDDYLSKPFEIMELAARVEALLGRVDQYKDMSRIDSLTGALNRKAFEENLNRKILKAQREGSSLSLVMADLDHFKKVNDTHGHLAGDFVLRALVRFLDNSLREVDVVARYGGEEFCIIMPDTIKQTAAEILERIRKQLSETTFLYEK